MLLVKEEEEAIVLQPQYSISRTLDIKDYKVNLLLDFVSGK